MSPIRVLFAVAVITIAACDHEPRKSGDEARERWSDVQPTVRARIAELRSEQTVLAGRIGALTLPPGVDDRQLASLFATLQARVATLEGPIAALENDATTAIAEVEAAFAARDRVRARRAVEAAEGKLAAATARATAAVEELAAMVPEAERALQTVLAAQSAEQSRFTRAAAAGGALALPAVQFRGDTGELALDHVATKAALDRLAQMTGTCPELRMTITAYVTRPDAAAARALGLARAEAVRAYLLTAGVRPETLAMSPAEPAAQPQPDQVIVTVTTPCTAPVAQPVAPTAPQVPPPTAERAAAPGHEGHGH